MVIGSAIDALVIYGLPAVYPGPNEAVLARGETDLQSKIGPPAAQFPGVFEEGHLMAAGLVSDL